MNALRNFFSPAKPSRVTTPRSGIEAARAALSSRALESPNVTPTPTSTPVGKAPVPVNIFDDGEISFFQRSQSIASEGASAAVAAKNAAALVCRKFRAGLRKDGRLYLVTVRFNAATKEMSVSRYDVLLGETTKSPPTKPNDENMAALADTAGPGFDQFCRANLATWLSSPPAAAAAPAAVAAPAAAAPTVEETKESSSAVSSFASSSSLGRKKSSRDRRKSIDARHNLIYSEAQLQAKLTLEKHAIEEAAREASKKAADKAAEAHKAELAAVMSQMEVMEAEIRARVEAECEAKHRAAQAAKVGELTDKVGEEHMALMAMIQEEQEAAELQKGKAEAAEAEAAKLQKGLQEMDGMVKEMASTIDAKTCELEVATSKLVEAEAKQRRAEEKTSEELVKVMKMKGELEVAQAKEAAAEAKAEKAAADLVVAKKAADVEGAKVKKYKVAYARNEESFKSQFAKAKEVVVQEKTAKAAALRAAEEAKAEAKARTAQAEKLRQDLAAMQGRLEEHQATRQREVDAAAQQQQGLEAANADLKKKVAEHKAAGEKANRTAAALQDRLTKAKSQLDKAAAEKKKAEDGIEGKVQSLAQAKTAELEEAAAVAKQDSKDLKAKLYEMSLELEKATKDAEEKAGEIVKLADDNSALLQHIESLASQ